MSKVWYRFLFFCMIGWTTSAASEGPEPQKKDIPLAWVDAIHTALASRIEMKLEEAQVRKAQARVNETYGLLFPTLGVSVGQERIGILDDFTDFVVTGTVGGQPADIRVTRDVPRYLVDAEMKLDLNLYAGGLHVAKVAEALSEVKEAWAWKSVARNKILLEVATAYWELRKAQINYQIALRAANFAQKEAKWSASEYQEGRISEIDAATRLFQATEKEIARDQTVQELKNRESKYISTLGVSNGMEEIPPIAELTDNPEQVDSTAILSEYVGEKSPELLALQSKIEAASAGIRVARSELFPAANLYARYATVGRDTDNLGRAWSDLQGNEWAAGFRLTWNLFNGFQSRNRIVQAHAEEEIALLQLQKAKQDRSDASRERLLRLKTLEQGLGLA